MGNPKFTLSQFSQLRQTRLPNSSASPHGRRTTHQPFVYLVARSCCLLDLCPPPSHHTRAPLLKTHLCSQSQHFTKSHCAHLHDGRALTQVTQKPVPSRRTNWAPTPLLTIGSSFAQPRRHTPVHAFLQPAGDPAHTLHTKPRYAFYFRAALPKNGRISKLRLPSLLRPYLVLRTLSHEQSLLCVLDEQ